MTGGIEFAAAVGAVALSGVGLMPFLHREPEPNAWFEVQWPREVDEDDALGLLRHLASSRRPSVVTFEARASHRHVTYLVGVVTADAQRLRHLFATFLPGALLEEVERPSLDLTRAIEPRLGTRERALRTDAPLEVARSVIGALVGTPGTTVVQWQVGNRLAPMLVPEGSVGLPSTGRAIGQAVRYGLAPREGRALTALETKVGDHGFRASLRIASTIPDPKIARGAVSAVVGALRVAETPGVYFSMRRSKPGRAASATPRRRNPLAFNVAELLGLLAWPLGDGDYPGVVRMASRRLPVPSVVPTIGRVVGDGNHPSTLRPIAISATDATMHMHVLGPTGVGKSTLLANLALQDIEAGNGLVVIEPKGDLVAEILNRVPGEREHDVVVLDPTDDVAPVGLNPLAGGSAELVADQLLAVFRGLYGDYLGPRTTDVLHAALLTLARSDRATLVALPLLLTDARLRGELTAAVRGDIALGPFWNWYDSLSDAERQQVIAPVMNKVRPFLLRERARHVLGQLEPKFDLVSVFSQRKILLVPLNTGTLGSETAGLIGSLVVARLWRAAQGRAHLEPGRRHPVNLVIDEFQDFLHLPTDLADVLAQARGLGLGLVLAHQHLAQLSPNVRSAVLANARSRVCFRLGAEDAAVIARTTPHLDAEDFQSLGRYEVYASLVADGDTQAFCSATTRGLDRATSDAGRVRNLSRKQFGRRRDDIETELNALWNPQTRDTKTPLGNRRRRTGASDSDGGER